MKIQGTPGTLRQAIENGINAKPLEQSLNPHLIENHVLDFLRQKFTVAWFEMAGNPKAIEILGRLAFEIGATQTENISDIEINDTGPLMT